MYSRRFRDRTIMVLAGPIAVILAAAGPAVADSDWHLPELRPAGEPAASRLANADETIGSIPGLTTESAARMRREQRVGQVAAQIRSIPTTRNSGVAGMRLGPDGDLQVYWHGGVPEVVDKRIGQARLEGVAVKLLSAPYTEAELLSEADRISRLPLHDGKPTGQRALRVFPRFDGTGLEVGLAGLPVGVEGDAARRLVPALRSHVPLNITGMGGAKFAYRYIDDVPYFGGALMVSATRGNSCSTGFGVTGLNGAATYLITAAHCGEGRWDTGTVVLADGSTYSRTFGNTIAAGRSTGRDAELILTPGGAGAGVYWGASINPPSDPGSNSYVAVSGAGTNLVDRTICASGAFSGTQCGATIRATNVIVVYDPPTNGVGRVTNLVWAQNLPANSSSAFVGQGDSGGPITSLASGGRVQAQGIISGIETGSDGADLRTCKGYNYPGRQCSYSFYYADLSGAMSAVGVRINTQ
ncbi:hypothetical protein AB0J80_08150 [Actinoplanes sp. NPDC049548]|uniref:hypothetical protein n=1 Tax=Actinoplanes sp. NPDC049548 TaxID=3155152 RepID=UPI00344A1471